MTHRGKVLTLFTLFKINNLSAYTSPYIFWRVFTSLAVNNLSAYINVNANKKPQMGTQGFSGQAVPARPVAKRLKF